MSDAGTPTREAGSGGPFLALILLLMPLLYVLSIGPMVKLAELGHLPVEPIRVIYYPVKLLHDHTPLEKPLEWYAALWGWH